MVSPSRLIWEQALSKVSVADMSLVIVTVRRNAVTVTLLGVDGSITPVVLALRMLLVATWRGDILR